MRVAARLSGSSNWPGRRHYSALVSLTLFEVIFYWVLRLSTNARVQQVGRLVITGYRWLAWRAAHALISAAALKLSRLRTPLQDGSNLAQTLTTTQNGNYPAATTEVTVPDAGLSPARVTVTPTGVRIVDKRKIAIRPANVKGINQVHPGEDPIQAGSATVGQLMSGLYRAAVNATGALWFVLLGRLIRAAQRTPLPAGLCDTDLGRHVWQRTSCRQLIRGKPGHNECWSEMLDLAMDESAGDWRLPVTWWFNRHVPPAELARLVRAELGRPGRPPSSDRRLTLLLRLAAHVATALPDQDARAVIGTALTLSRRPIDPYTPNGLVLVSRSVVTTLLEQRPELDKLIINTLDLQRGESRMEPDFPLPVEARLLAIATRNRVSDFGATLSRMAVKAGLGPTQLEVAARLADAILVRPPLLRTAERTEASAATVGFIVRRVLPWLVPVLFSFGAGATAGLAGWIPTPISISLGESIALLALLVTVNVFTVQLSASRLPGIVARSAGQPWQLFSSYSAVLTLLSLSVTDLRTPWLAASKSWAALVALMLFVGSLLAAMFLLLERTDAGRAASGYVAVALPRARAAGRRLGRTQARAVEMREVLQTAPAVTMSPDAIAGEWSQDVVADIRGFFIPSRIGMRRLLAYATFRSGMRLRVLAGLGTIVGNGETVAALVPGRDQTVTGALAKQANKSLRTRSCKHVEEVATGAVALAQLALDLAKAGDTGTAHTVAQNVVRLVTEHTAATRVARAQMFRRQALRARVANPGGFRNTAQSSQAAVRERDTELVPVVPALRDSMRLAIRSRLNSREDLFDVPEALIVPLLSSSGEAEAGVKILAFAVPSSPEESTRSSDITELLRIAGVRALELRDSSTFKQVIERLDTLAQHAATVSDAIAITSVLGATACRFDARLSRLAVDHAMAQIAADSTTADGRAAKRRMMALWRVGAAGLACGTLSIAVYVARRLCEIGDQDRLATAASDEGLIAREATRSDIRGGYLGDQAMDALANFWTFLSDLAPVLIDPSEN